MGENRQWPFLSRKVVVCCHLSNSHSHRLVSSMATFCCCFQSWWKRFLVRVFSLWIRDMVCELFKLAAYFGESVGPFIPLYLTV